MALKVLGVILLLIGLLAGAAAFDLARGPDFDAQDAIENGRLSLIFGLGAVAALLSGVMVLLRRR